MGQGRLPRWVWNKGIAAWCDRRIPDEFPDGQTYVPVPTFAGCPVDLAASDVIDQPEALADIGGGELVWVRVSWLPAFVEHVLPRVAGDFVLVTGDSDSSLPTEAPEVAAALLDSPRVLHWYAQNYDGSAPRDRMSPLPIGIDLHTLSERPAWGQGITSPWEQQAELDALVATLPPAAEREHAIHIDLGWSTYPSPQPRGARLRERRDEVSEILRANPLVVADPWLPRSELWRRRGRFAFAVSPHGNGLDCHRTWEALALGQVVLVPSSPLDPLFDDVRAFPFAAWTDLTADNLHRWLTEAAEIPYPSPALTSEGWANRMRRAHVADATGTVSDPQ